MKSMGMGFEDFVLETKKARVSIYLTFQEKEPLGSCWCWVLCCKATCKQDKNVYVAQEQTGT